MTIDKIKSQNSLTREQKEAIGLLSIGTFWFLNKLIN